jgi:hypothetical protein
LDGGERRAASPLVEGYACRDRAGRIRGGGDWRRRARPGIGRRRVDPLRRRPEATGSRGADPRRWRLQAPGAARLRRGLVLSSSDVGAGRRPYRRSGEEGAHRATARRSPMSRPKVRTGRRPWQRSSPASSASSPPTSLAEFLPSFSSVSGDSWRNKGS